jgi:hypothetical protein
MTRATAYFSGTIAAPQYIAAAGEEGLILKV